MPAAPNGVGLPPPVNAASCHQHQLSCHRSCGPRRPSGASGPRSRRAPRPPGPAISSVNPSPARGQFPARRSGGTPVPGTAARKPATHRADEQDPAPGQRYRQQHQHAQAEGDGHQGRLPCACCTRGSSFARARMYAANAAAGQRWCRPGWRSAARGDEPWAVAPRVRREGQEEGRNADGHGVDDRQVAGQERVRQQGHAHGDGQQRRPDRLGDEEVGDPLDVGPSPGALRPTTPGQRGKPAISSTSSATAFRGARPNPTAIPRSASFSASTSLTTSPVMATCCPSAPQRLDHLLLLMRGDRPKTERFLQQATQRGVGSSGQVDAHRPDRRPGAGPRRAATALTVCGLSPETLSAPRLGREVGDGLGPRPGLSAPRAGTNAAARRFLRRDSPSSDPRPGQHEHPPAASSQPGGPATAGHDGQRAGTSSRRSQNPGAVPGEAGRAPLARRRERNGGLAGPSRPAAGTPARWPPGSRSGPSRRRARRALPRRGLVVEPDEGIERDGPVGQGAGLVEAHDVHPGQALDRGQLLDQDPAPGQRDRGPRRRRRWSAAPALW